MATKHYHRKFDSCVICGCDGFEAGYVDARLKDCYWPHGAPKPDFEGLRDELMQRYNIEVTEQEIEEHWDRHVRVRLDEYRERAMENAEHGIAETRYDPEMLDDE